ncbi:hypothetical protein CPB86DRAFT_701009 [Serendipita vermifera]|nr:hypothetical protein CPB86DRAFT_701009 [Serendipita vermifera]
MQPFASYILRKYYEATGWNEDNLYSNLTRSSNAILDFQVPRGLHFHVSKAPNTLFKTTYSLNALPDLNGSLGYIFTSCDLKLESSAAVHLRDVVQRFKVYDQPRSPEKRPEVWLAGERVDKRDYLMYGRLYVPTGRLDALYSTRLGTSWQVVAAAVSELRNQSFTQRTKQRRTESIDHSNILLNLQHDRGKWCSEYTWSAVDGLWGARVLYNFGKPRGEETEDRYRRREKRVDEEEAMEGGLKGRISAGAEVYFSAREKSGGVSTAIRFTTIPDPVTQLGEHPETSFSQPPTTITAVLNPILGHISAAYASRVSNDLALCSRFDFNVYSYESEWSLGAEWWVRSNEPVSAEGAITNKHTTSSTQGLLKAKLSTNYDVSLLWEGRLKQVLVGLGVVSDLSNRSKPIRALGVEVAYFS